MTDTYFFIEVEFASRAGSAQVEGLRYGPYLSLTEASQILLDNLPEILQADTALTYDTRFRAKVVEKFLYGNAWETIRTILNDESVLLAA